MNTSQYPAETRKHIKRFQRSPGYAAIKQEHRAERENLQATHLAARAKLQATINRLKEKLVEAGVNADEVAKLAA